MTTRHLQSVSVTGLNDARIFIKELPDDKLTRALQDTPKTDESPQETYRCDGQGGTKLSYKVHIQPNKPTSKKGKNSKHSKNKKNKNSASLVCILVAKAFANSDLETIEKVMKEALTFSLDTTFETEADEAVYFFVGDTGKIFSVQKEWENSLAEKSEK